MLGPSPSGKLMLWRSSMVQFRPSLVDSLNGGFFTRSFSAVGWSDVYNGIRWPFASHFKWLYLSVGLIEAKIWQYNFFTNFPFYWSFFGCISRSAIPLTVALGAAIDIPCDFWANLKGSILSQNNMGCLWQPLNWTMWLHHIDFPRRDRPSIQILHWKSVILYVVLLSPNWVPDRLEGARHREDYGSFRFQMSHNNNSRSTTSPQLSAYAPWLQTHRQIPCTGNDSCFLSNLVYCSLQICCTRQSRALNIDRCAPEIQSWPLPWPLPLTPTFDLDLKVR